MVQKSASAFIAQSLVDAGVKNVYGGHGGALVPLVNAVCEHPDLNWVCTRNEANASLMAAADSKLTGLGRLACCIATSGPGASNLMTGLLDAQLDRLPMIAITGTKPRTDQAHSEFQDIDQSRLFAAGGLAYSVTVSDPLQLVAVMRDAVAIALTQRACVHVAVPVDIQGMKIQAPTFLCSAENKVQGRRREVAVTRDEASLDGVAKVLASPDERVVIAIGYEGRQGLDDESSAAIVKLAEATGCPMVYRLDAKGGVDESHPLAMGVVGVHGKPGLSDAAAVIEASTLVLALGVNDLHVLLCDPNGYQVRRLVEVAVDAHGLSTRWRAEHVLLATPSKVCEALLARLPMAKAKLQEAKDGPDSEEAPVAIVPTRQPTESEVYGLGLWKKALKSGAWKVKHPGRDAAFQPSAPGFCHPGALMSELSKVVRAQDVICIDTGDVTLWAGLCLCLTKGNVTLSSERLGTMGYALCAGIAASLEIGPTAKSVVIVGDGGFQMTMNELGTAIQHKANLLIIVMDNGVLGRVEFGFNDAKGCQIVGCDWVALAKSYGANGVDVRDDASMAAALAQGMASEGVFVLAAYTDPRIKADMAKTGNAKLPYWLSAPTSKVDSG